jgi:hypothetical protein
MHGSHMSKLVAQDQVNGAEVDPFLFSAAGISDKRSTQLWIHVTLTALAF